MESTEVKVCLICGVNTNKKQRHDRYNHLAPIKKKGKYQKDEESGSDQDSDDSLINSKSKKKTPQRTSGRSPAAAGGSRQTRNQNPKIFAASLCKVMELPFTADQPFLQMLSRAHYCGDCNARVKDIHNSQLELEKLQERIAEARADLIIDFSNHLGKIPGRRNLTRDAAYEVYENDIKLILDYNNENEKKTKAIIKEKVEVPKRERRQAAINSTLKIKRKLEENGSEENDEVEDEEVKVKETSKKKKKSYETICDEEFLPEGTSSSETEKEEPGSSEVEVKEESSSNDADNGISDAIVKEDDKPVDVKEDEISVITEEKPAEIVKAKKDPNLKCPHCPIPRYFNISTNLEEHISKCHAHSCDVCDKKFKSDSDMRKHKAKVHTTTEDKSSYICGFCDQEFQLKKYLEDHLDQHPEAKPLNCHQCGRGFSRKESLQKAFQIYKGEAVEPCKYCGRNLTLKDYLEHNKQLKQS